LDFLVLKNYDEKFITEAEGKKVKHQGLEIQKRSSLAPGDSMAMKIFSFFYDIAILLPDLTQILGQNCHSNRSIIVPVVLKSV
jgi:hypothetical protein